MPTVTNAVRVALAAAAITTLASCSSGTSSNGGTTTAAGGTSTTADATTTTAGEPDVYPITADQSIEVPAGSAFELSLEANMTTGYAWTQQVTGTAVRNDGGRYVGPDAPVEGAGGTQLFDYTAVETGMATIELVYSQAGSNEVGTRYVVTVQVS